MVPNASAGPRSVEYRMNSVLASATAGLAKAGERFNAAADRIVRQTTTDRSGTPAGTRFADSLAADAGLPGGIGNAGSLPGATAVNAQSYTPSLAEDMVTVRSALHQYKVTASLIRTSDELSQALLNSLQPGNRR